jgi:hypothetical protein
MKTPSAKKNSRRQPALNSRFWKHILNHRELQHRPSLEKILAGCEIIAALDGQDLLWS